MKELTLKRLLDNKYGTFGALFDVDTFLITTLERSWEDNKTDVSCIPPGRYLCMRTQSPKFGDTFEVTGVNGRSSILLHKGNYALSDSHGCILLGSGFAMLNNQLAISQSGDAFAWFHKHLDGEKEFWLNIIAA